MLWIVKCPDDGRLLALVEGDVGDEDARSLRAHLAACADCRVAVAEAARAHYPEGEVRALHAGEAMGRYVVRDKLGEGGMGVVYAADDPQLKRTVALKVLRPSALAHRGASARLLREAQAMARLSHPNVVTVYDVGTVGEQVFLAMEYVEGVTLTRWLADRPRGHDEVLAAFVHAGEGLAAAHKAQLIHRDFKPDNVLVASDGRILVTDFGLACSPVDDEETELATPGSQPARLTAAGAVAGTPGFMAPEQLAGKPLDAKTDQFSFSVALYAALCGERPFASDERATVPDEVSASPIRRLTSAHGRKIPVRIRRVLVRGLSADPADRFPSMVALLAALTPRRRWRVAAACTAVILLITGVAVGARLAHHDTGCGAATDRLVGIWDAPRRQQLETRFRATGSPIAAETWPRIAARLDAYASAWLTMASQACEATRVRHEQSEDLLELRQHCLDGRLGAYAALIDMLATPDRALVERSLEAVATLPAIEACANTRTLKNRVDPPRDPEVARAVIAVRAQVAAAHAFERGGRYPRAVETARAAVAAARPLGYVPVEAEALFALGLAQGRMGDHGACQATLEQALSAAQAGGHDEIAARAWIQLMHFVGYERDQYAEGHRWNDYTVAALQRLGDPDELEVDRLNWYGAIVSREGRLDDALIAARQQLAVAERAFGKNHVFYAYALVSLSFALKDLRRDAEAEGLEERGCKIVEQQLGTTHPQAIRCLNNRSAALTDQGRFEEALPLKLEAVRLAERLEDRSELPVLHTNLGVVYLKLERFDEARREFQVAGGIATLVADRVAVERGLGAAAFGEHSLEAALAHYRAALTLIEPELGPSHLDAGKAHSSLAEILLALHRSTEALAHAERAIEIADARHTASDAAANALLMAGEAQLALGAPLIAVPLLERCLTMVSESSSDSLLLPRTRFTLARALSATGADPARIAELVRSARDAYVKSGRARDQLHAIDTWVSHHPGVR